MTRKYYWSAMLGITELIKVAQLPSSTWRQSITQRARSKRLILPESGLHPESHDGPRRRGASDADGVY